MRCISKRCSICLALSRIGPSLCPPTHRKSQTFPIGWQHHHDLVHCRQMAWPILTPKTHKLSTLPLFVSHVVNCKLLRTVVSHHFFTWIFTGSEKKTNCPVISLATGISLRLKRIFFAGVPYNLRSLRHIFYIPGKNYRNWTAKSFQKWKKN